MPTLLNSAGAVTCCALTEKVVIVVNATSIATYNLELMASCSLPALAFANRQAVFAACLEPVIPFSPAAPWLFQSVRERSRRSDSPTRTFPGIFPALRGISTNPRVDLLAITAQAATAVCPQKENRKPPDPRHAPKNSGTVPNTPNL